MDFPTELLELLFTKTAPKEQALLCTTCKKFYKIYRRIPGRKLGKLILKPLQLYLAKELAHGTEGIYEFRAPMSYGKTITGLALVFSTTYNYLIIAPGKALETWVEQAKLLMGEDVFVRSSPEESKILLLASSAPRHLEYFKAKKDISHVRAIILSTRSSFLPEKWAHRTIVDEAHLLKGKIDDLSSITPWTLLLSAEKINTRRIYLKKSYIVSKKVIEDIVPETDPHYYIIPGLPEELTNFSFPSSRGHMFLKTKEQYIEALNFTFDTCDGKIVVFVPGGKIMDTLKEEFFSELSFPVYYFVKSLKVLEKFEKCETKALLVLSQAHTEAINLVCDTAVFVRPDWLSTNHCKQMIGRVLRTRNPKLKIPVFYITTDIVGVTRTVYSESLVSLGLVVQIDTIPSYQFVKAFTTVKLLGQTIEELSPIEVAIVLNTAFDPPITDKLYKVWKESQDNRLSEETVRTMLLLENL